ncbi:Glycosyl phosphatidyl inositol protein transamidase complex subunit [Trapelia coarctata]|nr:Glycosyl phosphatidyl inositol protein transamidase complex subunit [Trapelia coarctata]
MALLSPTILALRRDPRLLKLPPYLSTLCVIIGVVWLLLLPLNEYSRNTYISENALLPGQVHTYFGGSEQNIWNAYKHEMRALAGRPQEEISQELGKIFRSAGLKVATQKYEFHAAGNTYQGENVYSILHAPRGDATEAIVLVAAWWNMDGELNQGGVALVLTLARYFKKWSLWSKDIIILITPDSIAGPQAWVDAYHDAHSPPSVASLPLKSGALQGAIVVDNALNQRFESLHITYDGINGQLPNLDLFNTAVSIASGQMGIGVSLQRMWKHGDTYRERLTTMLRGMTSQGLGHASGPHSSFMPYHVDAITLTAVGLGWHDEMAMGRVIESIFRSLNNIMEHLHQSFFFYILMQANRFVSIGTYLPSAMLVAVNFSIMAIALWIQSGRPPKTKVAIPKSSKKAPKPEVVVVKHGDMTAIIPKQELAVVERQLFLPMIYVLGLHFIGVVPLYIFNNTTQANLSQALYIFTVSNLLLPTILSTLLDRYASPTHHQRLLIKCFSLLLLGMFLATLATLNFSLAFLIGLLAFPLSIFGVPPSNPPEEDSKSPLTLATTILSSVVLHSLSPPVVLAAVCYYSGVSVEEVMLQAAFGWEVSGLWTQPVYGVGVLPWIE